MYVCIYIYRERERDIQMCIYIYIYVYICIYIYIYIHFQKTLLTNSKKGLKSRAVAYLHFGMPFDDSSLPGARPHFPD